MGRVSQGDRAAFASLYDTHGAPIMGFLFRMSGDRQLAEDLTQETFLRMWRAAPRWRPTARVSTWLYVIARRLWWNAAARRRHRQRHLALLRRGEPMRQAYGQGDGPSTSETAVAGPPGDERAVNTPLEQMARKEAAQAIEAALATVLPPRLRLIFVLLRVQHLSLRETAQIAGIPIGTVKSRAAAAEAALRRFLDP